MSIDWPILLICVVPLVILLVLSLLGLARTLVSARHVSPLPRARVVEMRAAPPASVPALSAMSKLTPREREVAVLAAQGLSNARIADTLRIAHSTVANHLNHVFHKLGVGSRHDLKYLLTQDIDD